MTSLLRGHVVSLRRGGVGVVWRVRDGKVAIVPIWGANGPPRHRAEVRITEMTDIMGCGISLRHPVARCHIMHEVAAEKLEPEPLGMTPPILLGRIVAAVTREAATRASEDRLMFMRPLMEASGLIVSV